VLQPHSWHNQHQREQWDTDDYDQAATEEGNPCDKDVYHSATYEVPDGQELTWSISCSGHTSCCQSGTYTPHCSE